MSNLIDLALVNEAENLLDKLVERHGINWFLARDGKRLMALDRSKIDLVVETVVRARKRRGRQVMTEAVEHCRRKVRRQLIRRVAMGMVASGC